MNVIYLDQNAVIGLAEKSEPDRRFARAREIVLRLVEAKHAIFPYSEIHFTESEAMFPESQRRIGSFWETISRGYRFGAGKDIRSLQFKDVFHGRKTRFSPHLCVFRDFIGFAENINQANPAAQIERADRLRDVVQYWATLTKEEIDGRIRTAEATASSRMVMGMMKKWLSGHVPSLGEIHSEYNTVASELSEEFRNQGEDDDCFFKAVAFMREHALEVLAVAIECVGLESLAEQYALDNKTKRSVQKSQLDHDANDLAALSNFVPYCDAAISDGNAVGVVRRAYKKLRNKPPQLFTWREIEKFTDFLEAMPAPETETRPESEIERLPEQTLFMIPHRKKELMRRESLTPQGRIGREILPFGGLKVSSEEPIEWDVLLAGLEASLEDVKKEVGGEAVMYGGRNAGANGEILFKIRVPLGMFNLCRDEIHAAFKSSCRSPT